MAALNILLYYPKHEGDILILIKVQKVSPILSMSLKNVELFAFSHKNLQDFVFLSLEAFSRGFGARELSFFVFLKLYTSENSTCRRELCMEDRVLAHLSKRRQLCVHDLFSAEVLFRFQSSICKQHLKKTGTFELICISI